MRKTFNDRWEPSIHEFPLNGERALVRRAELRKSTLRAVNGILILTSRAGIRNGRGDALALVVHVVDLHLAAAILGFTTGVAIHPVIF